MNFSYPWLVTTSYHTFLYFWKKYNIVTCEDNAQNTLNNGNMHNSMYSKPTCIVACIVNPCLRISSVMLLCFCKSTMNAWTLLISCHLLTYLLKTWSGSFFSSTYKKIALRSSKTREDCTQTVQLKMPVDFHLLTFYLILVDVPYAWDIFLSDTTHALKCPVLATGN